jgi:hypothetical protein
MAERGSIGSPDAFSWWPDQHLDIDQCRATRQGFLVSTERAGSRPKNRFEPAPTARVGASAIITKCGQEP